MGNGIGVGGVPPSLAGASTPLAQNPRANSASAASLPVDFYPATIATSRVRPPILSPAPNDAEPASACSNRPHHNPPSSASPFSPFPKFPTLPIPCTGSNSLLSASGAADDAPSLRTGANSPAEAGCTLDFESPHGSPCSTAAVGANTPTADKIGFLRPGEARFQDREPSSLSKPARVRSAKLVTWLLWLRAQRAAGIFRWATSGFLSLTSAVHERLLTRGGADILDSAMDGGDECDDDEGYYSDCEDDLSPLAGGKARFDGSGTGGGGGGSGRGMLIFLRVLLLVSVLLLIAEVCAHSGELQWEWYHWLYHGRDRTVSRWDTWANAIYQHWAYVRATWIGRPLQWATRICVYLFLLQSLDRIILALGGLYLFITRYRPQPKGRYEADAAADPERPSSDAFPMVLVQIPMCNEREVYDQSIAAACQLDWPASRFLVQVLDDSSDEETAGMIRAEVEAWAARGAPIVYRKRADRKGYKAGNLASAMACDYVRKYEFVAIFDADFQPRPDFLRRTIPHFKDQPDVALVQARWSFVNREENLLTRLQNINLAFHFEVEQQVNGAFLGFFGFNGTAGVWRISALEDSGGWLDRTTVEDMDLAVRAHLKGWRFVFVNDVEVLCELPQSYEAYRKQQHRWHSGPMQLFRLCLGDIITAKIPLWKKLHLILFFFLLRKMILPFYSFLLFCVLLPLTIFVPEASLPLWVVCYIPGLMSLLNVLPSPASLPFTIPYLLFENTMSVTKFHAMVAGLFQLKSAHEWVVTKKTGGGRAVESGGGGGGGVGGGGVQQPSVPTPAVADSAATAATGTDAAVMTPNNKEADTPKRYALGALSGNVPSRLNACSDHTHHTPTTKLTQGNHFNSNNHNHTHNQQQQQQQTPHKAKTSPVVQSCNYSCSYSNSYSHGCSTTTPLLRPTPPPSHLLAAWRGTPKPASADAAEGLERQSETVVAVQATSKAKASRRIYPKELALAALLVTAAARSLLSSELGSMHFYFLLFQGIAFLIVGLDVLSDP